MHTVKYRECWKVVDHKHVETKTFLTEAQWIVPYAILLNEMKIRAADYMVHVLSCPHWHWTENKWSNWNEAIQLV